MSSYATFNNQVTLRDAFNREVFPNRAQPGAYEASNAFDNRANYGQSGGSSDWPLYNVQSSPMIGNYPNYGDMMAGDCNTCQTYPQQPSGHHSSYGSYGYSELSGQKYTQPVNYQQAIQRDLASPINAVNLSVNEMLIKYLRQTVAKLSGQLRSKPDWIDLSPDGGASWKYSTMVHGNSLWCRVFTKIEISGERKAYTSPIPHIGNITTTTKIKLNYSMVSELQRELPMISYCPSTKTLQITMDTLEHCLAVLALVCACQQDKISLNKIKYHDLCKKYLLLTTPGNKRYRSGAKYALVRLIRK